MIIKIIKSHLRSVEVNIILKVTNFAGTIYIFYLHSQHFGNHVYGGRNIASFAHIVSSIMRRNYRLSKKSHPFTYQ